MKDYEREIADGELETAMALGELSIGAPHRMVARLRTFDVAVDDVVSMRLQRGSWSVLVRTGPDADDNRRFSAGRAGETLKPSG